MKTYTFIKLLACVTLITVVFTTVPETKNDVYVSMAILAIGIIGIYETWNDVFQSQITKRLSRSGSVFLTHEGPFVLTSTNIMPSRLSRVWYQRAEEALEEVKSRYGNVNWKPNKYGGFYCNVKEYGVRYMYTIQFVDAEETSDINTLTSDLNNAIAEEDYEKAAKISDKIEKLKRLKK